MGARGRRLTLLEASGQISTETTMLLEVEEAEDTLRRAGACGVPSARLILGGPAVRVTSAPTW